MDNTFKSPTVISFCPGILGIERGLARAGTQCRVVAYVEIEAFIIANLVAGMETGMVDPAPIWTDAKTFDASPFRGKIHGIIGGYPCPGESLAGLREGHLYKGFIWPAIRRAIAAARPIFCFFENVDDHLTGTYPIVQRSLRNMGYAIEAGIYSASEAGAPHERQRLFILALDNAYRDRLQQEYKISARGNSAELAGKTMADGISQGLEIWKQKSTWEERAAIERSSAESKWPALPGSPEQFSWEVPRTIEPGVGCTIDGYNFREDFLRALGNSVVEQTAEIAWKDLLRKHFLP